MNNISPSKFLLTLLNSKKFQEYFQQNFESAYQMFCQKRAMLSEDPQKAAEASRCLNHWTVAFLDTIQTDRRYEQFKTALNETETNER